MKIAIVANDEIQAEILKTIFTSEAYEVTIFSHGMACLKQLESCSFDFFVIDWTLPDIRGSEILRHIRENSGWTVPVVLCNISKEDISTDILQFGADDYIPKPIRYMEFFRRVEPLLSRHKAGKIANTYIGNYEIDLNRQRILLGGKDIDLTQREFELASLLLMNIGRVFSREELLSTIWSCNSRIDSRTIDTHACRLRKKLGAGMGKGIILSSVYGKGYRLDNNHHGI